MSTQTTSTRLVERRATAATKSTVTTRAAATARATSAPKGTGTARATAATNPTGTARRAVAGILDLREEVAFLRTSSYLPSPGDAYVPMSMVRRYGLRRGDVITGVMRDSGPVVAKPHSPQDNAQSLTPGMVTTTPRPTPAEPLLQIDTVNGKSPEEAQRRPDFYRMTALYPQERLRLETESHILTTRAIDLVMPIGKGQRALIVAPPKTGKTLLLQAVAKAISHNNPECHLMVVLVDERPEEVTDMRRSVGGEVIASTFDRPPSDHIAVAELAIERAKRLVESGMDVVILLDSITRLGRAYNNAAPGNGRTLTGGIDSAALYPPKRFLGAARNIENGGSLTIIATALVETGSVGDNLIFEEFKGTGNAELRLDRGIAGSRVYPAIDIAPSGTRMEDILVAPQELAITRKLRQALRPLDSTQAMEHLLEQLRKTKGNTEFLRNLARASSR